MTLRDALRVILPEIGGRPAVFATGYICRQAQSIKQRAADFYMIGSMGMASSIGLGVALSCPGKTTVVIDGDGAVLMNLGTLAMIGTLRPRNLVHIVLDNESYESTGAQPTYSRAVRLDRVARSSGYATVGAAATGRRLRSAVRHAVRGPGPAFLLVKVRPDRMPVAGRIERTPEEITRDFRAALR